MSQNVYCDFTMFLFISDCIDFDFSFANALKQSSSFPGCSILICWQGWSNTSLAYAPTQRKKKIEEHKIAVTKWEKLFWKLCCRWMPENVEQQEVEEDEAREVEMAFAGKDTDRWRLFIRFGFDRVPIYF